MQAYNFFRRAVDAAADVRDMTDERKTYRFTVGDPVTLYLQAEQATVRIVRWQQPTIEFTVTLRLALGWRYKVDHDDAGVYIAAQRRRLVGGLSHAAFTVSVPDWTYVLLKLTDGSLTLDGLSGTQHILPANMPLTPEMLDDPNAGLLLLDRAIP